jgi:hypothetical protein
VSDLQEFNIRQREKDEELYHWKANKVKVGKKVLTFENKDQSTNVKFEKRNFLGKPSLWITTYKAQDVTERCSMGHYHKTGRKEETWAHTDIPWEHIESLIAWLETGNWKELQKAGAKT